MKSTNELYRELNERLETYKKDIKNLPLSRKALAISRISNRLTAAIHSIFNTVQRKINNRREYI